MALFKRKPQMEAAAPSQMAAEALYNEQKQRAASYQGGAPSGVVGGIRGSEMPIGAKQIAEANATLRKYREGKANLENRIVANEQWYKLRHWECLRGDKKNIEPTSAWLFNCIANKHADAMDNFPAANFLPREEGDKGEAEMLTSIVPVILEQNDFEQTYSDEVNYKLKQGTGVYGVFWDTSKPLGDVAIRQIDLLNLFWESGVKDIQKSRNLFHVELMDNELLEANYPQLTNKLGSDSIGLSKYVYDDSVDTTNKSAVIDWYYKKNVGGKTILHYCKFVNDVVLFATENDPAFAERGLYDHGQYPFVFDPLFTTEGTPTGFGYIDIGKNVQEFIDRGNQAIMKNMLSNAKPRHFINNSGAVNEEEYANMDNDFVHVDGSLGQDSILPIQGKPLNDIYVQVIRDKIEELKETTGNRDVSQGGTTGGVTAASAIAAQMEAGSKLSRDSNKGSYRAFRKVCLLVVELIRQFYDVPRSFRIIGENGAARFVKYSNENIIGQPQEEIAGIKFGARMPLFDIEITAQKQSPYSKMAQNELALQFYNAGFFNPQMSDQALACLDMMDFDRKQFVMQKISQNGTLYQQVMMLQQQMLSMAQIVDRHEGTNLADQIAAGIMGGAPVAAISGSTPPADKVRETEALGGEAAEPSVTKKARERVAESTSPT